MIFEGDETAPVPKALVKGQPQRKQRTNRRSWAIGRILDTACRSHKFLAKTGTCNSGEKNRPTRNGANRARCDVLVSGAFQPARGTTLHKVNHAIESPGKIGIRHLVGVAPLQIEVQARAGAIIRGHPGKIREVFPIHACRMLLQSAVMILRLCARAKCGQKIFTALI